MELFIDKYISVLAEKSIKIHYDDSPDKKRRPMKQKCLIPITVRCK